MCVCGMCVGVCARVELGLQVVVSCWAYVLRTEPGPLEKQVFF